MNTVGRILSRIPGPDQARRELVSHRARVTDFRAEESVALNSGEDRFGISATYFLLRLGLAVLAIGFPIVLVAFAGLPVQSSLSAYYHFAPGIDIYGGGRMRNVFVGVLWAIGMFLLLYRGYSREEDRALNLAGVAAVLVALFPTNWPAGSHSWVGVVHVASAVSFFLAIAYVCVFRAKDTLDLIKDVAARRRFQRGYTILGTWMVVAPLSVLLLHTLLNGYVILLIEVSGVWVFAAFWLLKSREILTIEGSTP